MTKKQYRVVWEIDIEADSPFEAAHQALAIQREKESLATVFEVFAADSSPTRVDLHPDEGVLSIEQWEERYKPVFNHQTEGYLFETYGEDLDFVQSIAKNKPKRVWTLVAEGDTEWLVPGMKLVNRVGYVITNVEATDFPIWGRVRWPQETENGGTVVEVGEPSNDNPPTT